MLYLTSRMVLAQFAGDRVRHDLEAPTASIHNIAQDLAPAASHNVGRRCWRTSALMNRA